MSIESALLYMITSLEVAVIAVALWRRIPRLLPVFFAYLIWTVVSDLAGNLIRGNSQLYSQFFRYEMPLDSVLQFGVLVELAWSVLRPMRKMLPGWTILVISLLILGAGAATWPFTSFTVAHGTRVDFTVLLRLQQTFSVLRILFFLGLAALSQFLAISWRDRELQVATGLGFYSVMSMGAALLNTHPTSAGQFHAIEDLVAFSYMCSLLYWALSFMQKEAVRQKFSPRMQNLLLTVAGAARANRLAIEDVRKDPRH